jgi:hypothetical protein
MPKTIEYAEYLETMSVADLRRLACEKSIGSGTWRAGAGKAELVACLSGKEPTADRASTPPDSLAAAIAAAVQQYMPPAESAIDETAVRAIVTAELAAALKENVKSIEITYADKPTVKVGRQHDRFPALLKMVAAGKNVYLVGPAGSGKTQAAESVAKALSLDFFCTSVCQQTTKADLLGYQDAQGRYVPTLFRKAYADGGVFLLDEMDNGNPNVLAVLNAATSNGVCAFPDGMIGKHENFRLVAAGNTYGLGANRQYVGRCQMDGTTLNRFAFLDWPYDEALETAIGANRTWTAYVQSVRAAVGELGLRTIISPRASIIGADLLAAGLDVETTAHAVLWQGMDSDSVSKVTARVGAYQGA